MKKKYLKPEADFINFRINEAITNNREDDDYVIGSMTGEEGGEEW